MNLTKHVIYCDNQDDIGFSKNNIENMRTKYIDMCSYFVKENIRKFELKYVSGKHVVDVKNLEFSNLINFFVPENIVISFTNYIMVICLLNRVSAIWPLML